jgi:hypothetical protein
MCNETAIKISVGDGISLSGQAKNRCVIPKTHTS